LRLIYLSALFVSFYTVNVRPGKWSAICH